jgi:hypothetical protein
VLAPTRNQCRRASDGADARQRELDQSSGQSRPRRVVAIVKADLGHPDIGRAQCHGCACLLTVRSRSTNVTRPSDPPRAAS